MTPDPRDAPRDAAERLPRNGFERLLWLYGRKFWVALFAGVSSFVVGVVAIWIAARTAPATASIVQGIATAYFLAAGAMVGAYTAGNAVVERAHAVHGPAGAPVAALERTARASGAVGSDA